MEIKNTPNITHVIPMNQLVLDRVAANPQHDLAASDIAVQPDPMVIKQSTPALQPPAQLNKTYEISKDPPATVLKFTDPETKQVIMQVPNEASIRAYQGIQAFLKKQTENGEPPVKIIV